MATAAAPSLAPDASAGGGPLYVDTQHEDLVHDAQMDYYGAKLATCSSDRTVKVYDVSESSYDMSATLQGHEGPVWQVSWAHPKFGVLLASCSFDGSVLIHREVRPREWAVLHAARQVHESSVNGVAFGPHEFGLQVAAASSDGKVSVLKHLPNQTWSVDYLQDCPMGVNAVSWAPFGSYFNATAAAAAAGSDAAQQQQQQQQESPCLVTAGCDNQIRFWTCRNDGQWTQEGVPQCTSAPSAVRHSDWVRDVAWAPSMVPNQNVVASCSEDRTVLIWTQSNPTDEWKATLLHKFDAPVWRVSWSVTGHLLAVSSGDSDVTLWKKTGLDGMWTQMSAVPVEGDDGEATASSGAAAAAAGAPPPPPPQG